MAGNADQGVKDTKVHIVSWDFGAAKMLANEIEDVLQHDPLGPLFIVSSKDDASDGAVVDVRTVYDAEVLVRSLKRNFSDQSDT